MDHDHALAELDEIGEGEGEPPGQLSDAAERLDLLGPPLRAPALLLLFKPSEELRREAAALVSVPSEVSCCCAASGGEEGGGGTCCRHTTSAAALSILSTCRLL